MSTELRIKPVWQKTQCYQGNDCSQDNELSDLSDLDEGSSPFKPSQKVILSKYLHHLGLIYQSIQDRKRRSTSSADDILDNKTLTLKVLDKLSKRIAHLESQKNLIMIKGVALAVLTAPAQSGNLSYLHPVAKDILFK